MPHPGWVSQGSRPQLACTMEGHGLILLPPCGPSDPLPCTQGTRLCLAMDHRCTQGSLSTGCRDPWEKSEIHITVLEVLCSQTDAEPCSERTELQRSEKSGVCVCLCVAKGFGQ